MFALNAYRTRLATDADADRIKHPMRGILIRPFLVLARRARGVGVIASSARLVGIGAAVAAAVALVPAQADAAATYLHSARSGTFAGGRLTLVGVGRNVRWSTTSGRTGVAPTRFAQQRVFLHGMQPTGVLHIAGRRGGEKFAFRLSGPRYSQARRTVSYRATRLTTRDAATTVAAAVPRRFGPASLTVTPVLSSVGSGRGASLGSGKGGLLGSGNGASVGSGDSGNDCKYQVLDNAQAGTYLYNQTAWKWDTDTWAPAPPDRLDFGSSAVVRTTGGIWRGCHNYTTWDSGSDGPTVTIDFSWPWTQAPTTTCTPSDPALYTCSRADQAGEAIWVITSHF
jgi:hypothetical protein